MFPVVLIAISSCKKLIDVDPYISNVKQHFLHKQIVDKHLNSIHIKEISAEISYIEECIRSMMIGESKEL